MRNIKRLNDTAYYQPTFPYLLSKALSNSMQLRLSNQVVRVAPVLTGEIKQTVVHIIYALVDNKIECLSHYFTMTRA